MLRAPRSMLLRDPNIAVKNYLIKKLLLRNRLSFLEEKKRLYDRTVDDGEILDRQIRRFNATWKRCCETIPFYGEWRRKHDLPGRISSIQELQQFPPLTKRIIQGQKEIIFQNGQIRRYVSTGGSTGEPTRFPWAPTELAPNYSDMYLGRSWWGIEPLDPGLVFWGHSDLFGSRFKGKMSHYRRKIYDYLVNLERLNAYDMTMDTIREHFAMLRRSNATFIAGYTSSIYKLAKYVHENDLACEVKDRLKAVIVTAETITDSDVGLLEKVFCVPVVIEYGMAETGAIAYSCRTTWDIRLFWDSFIMTVGKGTACVTTLYEKCFPLINYDTEDVIRIKREVDGSVLGIGGVQGRKRDVLRVGTTEGEELELSGILMVHILKSHPHIFSIQFEQVEPNRVLISIVADRPLDLRQLKAYFLREIGRDHRNIDEDGIEFAQVTAVSKTLPGKELIVRA